MCQSWIAGITSVEAHRSHRLLQSCSFGVLQQASRHLSAANRTLRQGQMFGSHHWLQQSHVWRQEDTCGPASQSGLAAAGCAALDLGAARLEDSCRNAAACSAGGQAVLSEACTHCCCTMKDLAANLGEECLLHKSLPVTPYATTKSNNTAATAGRPMSQATRTVSHWAH